MKWNQPILPFVDTDVQPVSRHPCVVWHGTQMQGGFSFIY